MRTAKTLIRLGGSESSLGAQPHCWFCHVAAQIYCRLIEVVKLIKAVVAKPEMINEVNMV